MSVVYPPRIPLWLLAAAERLPMDQRGIAIGYVAAGYLAGFEDGRALAASGGDFANVPRGLDSSPPPHADLTPCGGGSETILPNPGQVT